ncbi:SRPBCC family protein [Pelagibacterium montanilacus]|uniref:SRPBCC family protein n=1 Tax=Pelagibacterium montanilacus TaxID=2185280 RepID=UPI000F8D2E05|nr:SRPBCC family protein [Pelagibacterium montanilacus]
MANVTARAEHRFATLTPDAVYDSWLDPERVRAWMQRTIARAGRTAQVTDIDIDAREGGWYRFVDLDKDGNANPAWGYYMDMVPGRRQVFTWFVEPEEEAQDNSTVTLELIAEGQGCLAVMTHEMDAQWAEYIEPTAKAWASMLISIEETA